MRGKRIRVLVFVIPVIALIMAIFAGVHAVVLAYNNNVLVAVNGQSVSLLSHAQFVQPAASSQSLAISVGLQVRNPLALDNLLQSINDPQSPQYRQYITPAQFMQDYAPTPDQVQQVIDYLQ